MPSPARSAAVLGLLTLAGCGAVLQRGPFEVPIESVPAGAVVRYQGEVVGITPCWVPVRADDRRVCLELAGHHPQCIDVGCRTNPWLLANVVTAGLGFLVDVALGTHVVPNTDVARVYLSPVAAPPLAMWRRPARSGGAAASVPGERGVGEATPATPSAALAKLVVHVLAQLARSG
jgi:hypothetical protein